MLTDFIGVLNIIGVIVFSVSGALKGLKYNLDILGIVFLGIITALGGGMMRDVLINVMPAALINERDLYFAIVFSIVTYFAGKKIQNYSMVIKIFDAAGLAVFTVIGAEKGLSVHLGMLGVIIMGTLTGVAGGIISDLLVNEIPFVLKEEVYALFCISGALFYWLFIGILKWNQNLVILGIILFIFIGRVLAVRFNWHLPKRNIS